MERPSASKLGYCQAAENLQIRVLMAVQQIILRAYCQIETLIDFALRFTVPAAFRSLRGVGRLQFLWL